MSDIVFGTLLGMGASAVGALLTYAFDLIKLNKVMKNDLDKEKLLLKIELNVEAISYVKVICHMKEFESFVSDYAIQEDYKLLGNQEKELHDNFYQKFTIITSSDVRKKYDDLVSKCHIGEIKIEQALEEAREILRIE